MTERTSRLDNAIIAKMDITKYPPQELTDYMKAVLRKEIFRRGLRPAYLGFHEHKDWSDPELWDSLLWLCYEKSILNRLPRIKERIVSGDQAIGFIALNIERFIGARQAKFDPDGHLIYEKIHEAIKRLSKKGKIVAYEMNEDVFVSTGPLLYKEYEKEKTRETLKESFSQELFDALKPYGKISVIEEHLLIIVGKTDFFRECDLVEVLQETVRVPICIISEEQKKQTEQGVEGESFSLFDLAPAYTDYESDLQIEDMLNAGIKSIDALKHPNKEKIKRVFQEYFFQVTTEGEERTLISISERTGIPISTVFEYQKELQKIFRKIR